MREHEANATSSSPAQGGDGVRIVERGGAGRRRAWLYKALALALVGGCVAYWADAYLTNAHLADADPPSSAHADASQAVGGEVAAAGSVYPVSSEVAPMPRRKQTPPAAPGNDLSLDLADYVEPGMVPTVAEVIERLHEAGIHSGIGAFSPPGTSPPLIGLAVPEDFPLPEGYVRHYQATDDGQRIEPILMFSPDYEFFDEAGRPIKIPENRVVPPEMAPPGLAIRRIEIPKPIAAAPIEPGQAGT